MKEELKAKIIYDAHAEALGYSRPANECGELTVMPIGYLGTVLKKYFDKIYTAGMNEVIETVKESRFHDDIHTSENLGIQSKISVIHKDDLLARLNKLYENN